MFFRTSGFIAEGTLFSNIAKQAIDRADEAAASGSLTPNAQVILAVLPIVSVIVFGVLAFFFLLWDYQKKVLLIKSGQALPPNRFDDRMLLLGIASLFIGAALLVFFIIYSGLSLALLGGIVPLAAGGGIVTFYVTVRGKSKVGR